MITVLQDSREKEPWNFTFHGFNQRRHFMKTGDYTLEGYENTLIIERKKSSGEISMNLGLKKTQFQAEMKRMESYTHKYIICEFPYERILEFPKNSGIPDKFISRIRINPSFMAMSLSKIKTEFDVEIIYCNDAYEAELKAVEIFNKVLNGN